MSDILSYTNTGAIRNRPLVPILERRIAEAVQSVYGPGFTAQVYSGGQEAKGQGRRRTGSVRHDLGRAADVYIVGPDGTRVTGDGLAPLAQYWSGKKYGGVGLEMRGGGIHLDAWETPPKGGGMSWNYASKGGRFTPAQRSAVAAGLAGELPDMKGRGMAALVDRPKGFDPVKAGAVSLDDARMAFAPQASPTGGAKALDAMASGQVAQAKPVSAAPAPFDPVKAGAVPFDPVASGAVPVEDAPKTPPKAAPLPQVETPQMQAPQVERRGLFRRVDDAVRGAADMLTFGFADEIAAGLGSATGVGGEAGNYAGNVAAQRERDAQGGLERFGGQVAGALAMPLRAANSLPGAIVQGATLGGVYGFGSGEGEIEDWAKSAAIGAAVGGAASGAVRGVVSGLQTRAAARTIPTNDQLRSAANAAYQAADDAGVIFKPEGVRRLANDIRVDLAEFGFHPKLQPRVAVVLDELEVLQNGNVTLKGMDVLRRIADNARKSLDPSEKAIGNRIIGKIDDFMTDATADDILTGNIDVASKALKEGRNLWSRLRKSEMVDVAALKAERRAASTGSGGNADNALRQNVRGLLDRPNSLRGMTEAEREAAERVVRGTTAQNALRQVGKAAPTGIVSGGLGASLGAAAGSALGGPAGAAVGTFAVPAIGQVAKSAADRMTVRSAERLSEIIRSGGQSAKDLAALARGGMISIERVSRLERIASRLGISVPELAAAAAETIRKGSRKPTGE